MMEKSSKSACLTGVPKLLLTLEPGDSLVLTPGQTHAWRNPSRARPAKALWIEQLAASGTHNAAAISAEAADPLRQEPGT